MGTSSKWYPEKKKNIPYGSRPWFKSQLSRATTRYGVVVFGAIIVLLKFRWILAAYVMES